MCKDTLLVVKVGNLVLVHFRVMQICEDTFCSFCCQFATIAKCVFRIRPMAVRLKP